MIRRELPVSVDIGSETYKIDADFRTIMNVEGIIFGKKLQMIKRSLQQR